MLGSLRFPRAVRDGHSCAVIAIAPGSDADPLVPKGWGSIEGLVCGFGHRLAPAPATVILLERQVHGSIVQSVPEDLSSLVVDGGDGLRRVPAQADALIAAVAGVVTGVRTADCVPILLVAPRRRWAVAVHAGWRGTIGGIAAVAVAAASRAGIRAGELIAALGPSIGPCCYEVSGELGERFAAAGLPVQVPGADLWPSHGKAHLDLRAANRLLLERSGLPASSVQSVGPCTRCSSDRFHSFRAHPASPGRQVSWVGWSGQEDQRPSRGPASHR